MICDFKTDEDWSYSLQHQSHLFRRTCLMVHAFSKAPLSIYLIYLLWVSGNWLCADLLNELLFYSWFWDRSLVESELQQAVCLLWPNCWFSAPVWLSQASDSSVKAAKGSIKECFLKIVSNETELKWGINHRIPLAKPAHLKFQSLQYSHHLCMPCEMHCI